MSQNTHNFWEEGNHPKCKRGKVYLYFVKYSPLHPCPTPPSNKSVNPVVKALPTAQRPGPKYRPWSDSVGSENALS